MQTYYWHDYETFGIDPQRDRPVQFAGLRTDENFNIIDEPLVIFCKPTSDYLPNPDACLITGISPQLAYQKGVCEAEFIAQINTQMAQPHTCTLGYNTLRFDDEVTRHCLYRNFYDPYAREWQNGNSRWDMIDVVRAARALRPEGIHWPVDEQGIANIRLDQLTIVNNIAHESAHDALSDVVATINVAKLIKQAQPKLFQYLMAHRHKTKVLELLQLGSFKPLVHISGQYGTAKSSLAVVVPVCKHPTNTNGVLVYDLSVDPEALLTLSVPEIQQRIFTRTEELPDGIKRIPLKTVHINKCPVLAPLNVLRQEDQQRLALDVAKCLSHNEQIKAFIHLDKKVAEVFSGTEYGESGSDPDLTLYSGGFFSDTDKHAFAKIRMTRSAKLAKATFRFTDKRLPEMLFRYKARNYPETLNQEEQVRWTAFCKQRLTGQQEGGITFEVYQARIKALSETHPEQSALLDDLSLYGISLMP